MKGDTMGNKPPGLFTPGDNAELAMMICTAGHVDHGKTELVKLLTGCRTDRLQTEQERGLTIELGFAPCLLQGTTYVGIVDVPGHDKFIRTMVTGVSGIDLCVLVIACDDGIMPQTVEHLQIMELLGMPCGMVALTKTDLVAPEKVEHVAEEIRSFLKGTFLEGADICPVSSKTGAGIERFYTTLTGHIRNLEKRTSYGVFRMPVVKTFTSEGHGAVVMGIPLEGAVSAGAEVECMPGHATGKIRSIQQFGKETQTGHHGQCLALNIPEFGKRPPACGEVLGPPGYLNAFSTFHVQLTMVPDPGKPLKNAEEIRFHTGTEEAQGKVYLLEENVLEGGKTGIASIVLSRAVTACPGDKFLIRRPSPSLTVAGGAIFAASPSQRKPMKKRIAQKLGAQLRFFDGADFSTQAGMRKHVEYQLKENAAGASEDTIAQAACLRKDHVSDVLRDLVREQNAVPLGSHLFIHTDAYGACMQEVREKILKMQSETNALALTVNRLREGLSWPQALWDRVLLDLEQEGVLSRKRDKLVLDGEAEDLTGDDRELSGRIVETYETSGFQSPRPDQLPELLGAEHAAVERMLEYLCSKETLFRLSKNVILSPRWMRKAQDMVIQKIQEEGALDSAFFKKDIGSSRKYALAILDFFDARNITVRIGNNRKLGPHYRNHLL